MDVVFQTRFSYFGRSGWRSEAAADPTLLFAPDRLERRFRYFEMITLPSLVAQTDPEFSHVVLSSDRMPVLFQKRLRELVNDSLGSTRARVIFRPRGHVGTILSNHVRNVHDGKRVAQVVLDDDDAISDDFVALVRHYGRAALDDPFNTDDYAFLSFPRGFSLGLEDGRPSWLAPRYVPYTNLGLTLVAPADSGRSPYSASHRKIGQRHPSVLITHTRPYYVRAVHEHNDSNAYAKRHGLDARGAESALKHFAFLRRFVIRPRQPAVRLRTAS